MADLGLLPLDKPLLDGWGVGFESFGAAATAPARDFSLAFLMRVARSGLLAVPGERSTERRFV